MSSSSIPVSKFTEEPYSYILGYPKSTKRELAKRVRELEKIGIKRILFKGPTLLNNIPVLGKGYVGVVVLARYGKKEVALKIRRIDSSREDMKAEAKFLRLANKVNVGPKVIDSSRNFIVMEYVDGRKIIDWVKELKGKGSTTKLRTVVRQVLEDCHNLDRIHLDHGELSYIHKHVIVGKSSCIIDFESASLNRRASNVTSATQGIFIGSGLAKVVKKITRVAKTKKMIESLKRYKHDKSRENFDEVLKVLGLQKV